MTGNEIRQRFLDFFSARGHRVVPSSSLVPANDPTLLFANAGMNQFKEVFLGLEKRDYKRATTAQKCVRAGGKHNDLENVGYTRRHHTFFEMLGNFSFGDYFKAEAIEYAWDLVTKDYGLPKDRLYVTIFREDDEAERLWQSVAGVPKERIFRLDEADNFWQMGETGPCGPCSEIHYDLGAEAAEAGRAGEPFPSDAGGRYVEIWNLVFMQYDRDASGKLTPLPRPSIDTGLGLERVAAVLQGKISNYDTDLLLPIILRGAELFGNEAYGADPKVDTALRIAADHARATAFLIHDGVLPSNEGRGYVLRKIMRRAMRNARLVGVEKPFFYELTGFVAELMKPGYPELMGTVQQVARVVKDEEHRYATTFLVAEKEFNDAVKSLSGAVLPGAVAFKLYDTYGLALDEQEDMARERGIIIDREGFEREMDEQRRRARASWKGAEKGVVAPAYQTLLEKGRTRFVGYDHMETHARVVGLLVNQQLVDRVDPGMKAELVLDETPFYAETGGQVGDQGALYSETNEKLADVETTYPAVPGLSVHRIVAHAPIATGDEVWARVHDPARHATMRNHTATHLLHAALRKVLGPHVKQAGSLVAHNRLRFDFTHYTAMDRAEIHEVERLMNHEIIENIAVDTEIMPLEVALGTGAMALFGEKYGDRVRVVSIPDFSKELCGGTHVSRTGDIGVCKVVFESSISAGVRRIEAVTGDVAFGMFQHTQDSLEEIARLLKGPKPIPDDLAMQILAGSTHKVASPLFNYVQKREEERRAEDEEVRRLKRQIAVLMGPHLKLKVRVIKNVNVVAEFMDHVDREQLRETADWLRGQLGSAIVVLGTNTGAENVSLVSAVTKDLTGKVHAGKLVGAVAQAVGGKGGGRPDMAEGGGKDAAALPAALEKVYADVESQL